MEGCGGEPNGEACGKYNGQGQLFFETEESYEKEEDAWSDSPESAFGVTYHRMRIG